MEEYKKEDVERLEELYKQADDVMDDLKFAFWIRQQMKKNKGFNQLKDKL